MSKKRSNKLWLYNGQFNCKISSIAWKSFNSKLSTPDQRNETEEDDQVERTKREIRQFSGVHTYNPYANTTLNNNVWNKNNWYNSRISMYYHILSLSEESQGMPLEIQFWMSITSHLCSTKFVTNCMTLRSITPQIYDYVGELLEPIQKK
jgi:hypothetical protein